VLIPDAELWRPPSTPTGDNEVFGLGKDSGFVFGNPPVISRLGGLLHEEMKESLKALVLSGQPGPVSASIFVSSALPSICIHVHNWHYSHIGRLSFGTKPCGLHHSK
jgi:hypothetical protein